jgi:hypothetical protein
VSVTPSVAAISQPVSFSEVETVNVYVAVAPETTVAGPVNETDGTGPPVWQLPHDVQTSFGMPGFPLHPESDPFGVADAIFGVARRSANAAPTRVKIARGLIAKIIAAFLAPFTLPASVDSASFDDLRFVGQIRFEPERVQAGSIGQ